MAIVTNSAQPNETKNGLLKGDEASVRPVHGIDLEGIRWETYEMLCEDLAECPGIRLTYDNGSMHIMTLLPEHESFSVILGQFVRVLATECQLPFRCFGSTTYKSKDLNKGLEPDNCFYLASLARILGKRKLDLARDPARDLALEIDITSRSVSRLPIYAALKVPEVWRFDGEIVQGYQLGEDGAYGLTTHSLAFPFLRLADLVPFLRQVFDKDEGSLTEAFRCWLKTEILPRWREANS